MRDLPTSHTRPSQHATIADTVGMLESLRRFDVFSLPVFAVLEPARLSNAYLFDAHC